MSRIISPFLISLIQVVALALFAQDTSNVYTTAIRPKALAVIGDRYHSPVHIRDGLMPAFARENVPVTFLENVEALTAESLHQFQLLVIFRDGMNWPKGYDQPHVKWMTDVQQQAIWEFVNGGGGFLAMHNAQGLYPPAGLYYKLMGGDYGGHPDPSLFTIRVENKNHPITAGIEDYEVFDEQHMVKYFLDREHLLLRSISRSNQEAAAGWWQEVAKGRMVYLSPGHTPEGLNHPMTQRLIRNSILWCLKSE